MFGSKKEKEEKKKDEERDQEGEGKVKNDQGDDIKIDFHDRRSSSMSKTEIGDQEGEQAEGRETETAEEAGEQEGQEAQGDKNAELLDLLQRLQAEFDNYRKRVQKERLESWNVAKRDMTMALLPLMDDMVRVRDLDDPESEPGTLLEGMKLMANKFMTILQEEGLERVDAAGKPFDPHYHEALMTRETDEPGKDNLVAEVLVEGYLFKGVLLRPARVNVLKYIGGDNEAARTTADEGGEKDRRDEAAEGETGDRGV